jgi:hypothetical protein
MSERLRVSPDALSRELEGEILVLDLRTSQYFGMTGTAARIWQLLEAGETREPILAALGTEFEGQPGAIAADYDAFVADLIERGLLVRQDSA